MQISYSTAQADQHLSVSDLIEKLDDRCSQTSSILPPNGSSLGHSNILTYSIQCSGRQGVWAMVHKGKFFAAEIV